MKTASFLPVKSPSPAVVVKPPWPTQIEIDSVAKSLDRLAAYGARINRALATELHRQPLDALDGLLDEFATAGWNCAALEARLNALEPAGWRNEHWMIQISAVSTMLAMFVGSFPVSNLPDPSVFARIMLDDVMAQDPCFVVLEGACRKLRQKSKFMPAICEILDAIKEEKKAWARRDEAIVSVEAWQSELAERIEIEKARRAAIVVPGGVAVGDMLATTVPA